jgi:hypothetical protein
MADLHKNFAYSLVATAPSPATTGTSLIVTAGQGALFPATPFQATIWITAAQPTTLNAEIVTVTAISTDTLTIIRNVEGSSARTVIIGDQIAATITTQTLNDVEGELIPATDRAVAPGFYKYLPDNFEVGSGLTFEIGSGGLVEVG